jgi:hypothetical protein
MSEEGWSSNPYTPGSLQWYIWNKYIGPRINVAISQKVIKETEVGKYLTQDWTFVTQLKSGDVIVQKGLTAENVANIGLEQAKRQILKE